MPHTSSFITAIALAVYCSSACPQATPPPPTGQSSAGQPAPSADTASSDAALTKAVHAALDADPNYFFRHVNVTVDKGVANLSGYVDSGAAINRARTVASKVPGITRVHTNKLHVDTQQRR